MRHEAYKNYLLAVLLLILAFNFVDRFALGLVLQDIKSDFHLSDTQLGLLSGMAFALFYSTMGIPLARWADRGNRVAIISITTALWCAAMALCGVANSFVQLLVIRVGVAVGEAGCIPPAHSLIADNFTRAERPRAVAIYMLGPALSTLLGFFLAGWLNQIHGWRMMFVILGLPGLALAALAWFTLQEPRRPRSGNLIHAVGQQLAARGNPADLTKAAAIPLREVWITLWSKPTFRNLLFCFSVVHFFGYGIAQWQGAFFVRSYGLQTGELGTWFSAIFGLGGLVGTYVGGHLASRHAAHNEPAQLLVMAAMYSSFGVISTCMYLSPSPMLAFALLALGTVGYSMTTGPLFAIIQTLVPSPMRAASIAIIYLFANLIGMGLGPLAAGALSDAFSAWAGDESLRYALVVLSPGYLWGGWHLWRASRTARRDLARVDIQ